MEYKPKFESEEESKKFEELMEDKILKQVDKMILSNDDQVLRFLEIFSSILLFEFNKRFPEPNYSIYLTYRIKSVKSNIDKISDYLQRLKEENGKISIKEITDLIGMRIVVEKIPHNISISKNNPEYEEFKELQEQRYKNEEISRKFHEAEVDILDGDFTYKEYYTKSKELINSILNILNSEKESKNYAEKLKKTYYELIEKCDTELKRLDILGEEDSKFNLKRLKEREGKEGIVDFVQLLSDFDSRIDSRLALKLYTNALPEIIRNSEELQKLGISISDDKKRNAQKREESGYVADFIGIDFEEVPLLCELQIMNVDEHEQSTKGYSAHISMPGKSHEHCELPPAYANRMIRELNNIGTNRKLNNDQLRIINIMMRNKMLNPSQLRFFNNIICSNNYITDINNNKLGIVVKEEDFDELKTIMKNIDTKKKEELYKILYNEGITYFNIWADNISALQVTVRLDKDSSVEDRVRIYYDNAYERLSNALRGRTKGYNLDRSNAQFNEKYLGKVYQYQNEWLNSKMFNDPNDSEKKNNPHAKSVMGFEIKEYIEDGEYDRFVEYIDNFMNNKSESKESSDDSYENQGDSDGITR